MALEDFLKSETAAVQTSDIGQDRQITRFHKPSELMKLHQFQAGASCANRSLALSNLVDRALRVKVQRYDN